MKRRTTITTEMERKMRELRAQGKSAKEIAAVIGVSATAVKNHTAGIIVPAEEKQARVEAVRRMYAEGKTYAQIEKEIGVSVATIRNYTQDMPRRKIRSMSRRGAESAQRQAQIEAIRRMYAEGKTYIQISAETGANSQTIRDYTRDLPRQNGNKNRAIASPEKPEQPATGQPGSLCRHKKTCRYWRPLSGLGGGVNACHYPIDRDQLPPWPADQCPGFPGPKTGPNPTPMGIKPRREKP